MKGKVQTDDFPRIDGMERYIGTNISYAKPMTHVEYCEFKGVISPENGADNGYLSQGSGGYTWWTSAFEFDKAYRRTDGMSFGLAVEAAIKGYSINRGDWDNQNMHVYLEDGAHLPLSTGIEKGTTRIYSQVFCLYATEGNHQPGWLPSQQDILALDWQIVD